MKSRRGLGRGGSQRIRGNGRRKGSKKNLKEEKSGVFSKGNILNGV
jgi:hypothetical protein